MSHLSEIARLPNDGAVPSIARATSWPFERGLKGPSATILFRIARQYGKSIEWLLTGATTTADNSAVHFGTGEITKRGVLAPKLIFFLGNQVG